MNNELTLSEFNITGEFIGLETDKKGNVKYLRLVMSSGDVKLKVPQELRAYVMTSLVPGVNITIFGVNKLNLRTGKIKLKIYGIKPLEGECSKSEADPTPEAKILVCRKSGCRKRGGPELLSELEKILGDRGLQDRVTIEETGCLKCCSKTPQCTLKLGKKEYKKLQPEAIAAMLENHLS